MYIYTVSLPWRENDVKERILHIDLQGSVKHGCWEHSANGDLFDKKSLVLTPPLSLSFCHLAVGCAGQKPTSLLRKPMRNHGVHWLIDEIILLHISPSQQFLSFNLKWRWVRLRTTHVTIFSSHPTSSVKVRPPHALDHLTPVPQKMGPAICSHFRCLLNTAAALFELCLSHMLHLSSSNIYTGRKKKATASVIRLWSRCLRLNACYENTI